LMYYKDSALCPHNIVDLIISSFFALYENVIILMAFSFFSLSSYWRKLYGVKAQVIKSGFVPIYLDSQKNS
jgi:hypothetical protein